MITKRTFVPSSNHTTDCSLLTRYKNSHRWVLVVSPHVDVGVCIEHREAKVEVVELLLNVVEAGAEVTEEAGTRRTHPRVTCNKVCTGSWSAGE